MQVFDFFSGCGGVSTGLNQAGLAIVYANDMNLTALETLKGNHADVVAEHCPIQQINHERLSQMVKKGVSLFVGCCPCQDFSRLNTTGNTRRRALVHDFLDVTLRHRPEFVFMENVTPAARSVEYLTAIDRLQKAGYVVTFRVLSFADYGLPQLRRRLVLVANRLGVKFEWPKTTHGKRESNLPPWNTLRGAISDLPPIKAGETSPTDPLHRSAGLTEINKIRIKATPMGKDWRSWPRGLMTPNQRKMIDSGCKPNTVSYMRLSWDQPAFTITTCGNKFSSARSGHPDQDRAFSLREMARLQGFPDDFVFVGSVEAIARQIGNAVPPLIARILGQAILKAHQTVQQEQAG